MNKYKEDKILICFIGTGRYINFLAKYYSTINNFFLKNTEKYFLIFTDNDIDKDFFTNSYIHKIEHREWPLVTLSRFDYLNNALNMYEGFKWFIFIDADMYFVKQVHEKHFFKDMKDYFGVQHPGFIGKTGTFESNIKSRAYVNLSSNDISTYWQGCFWGGKFIKIKYMVDILSKDIKEDLKNNIIAVWHDESYLNNFFIKNKDNVKTFDSSYAYPESMQDTLNIDPVIMHINKNNDIYPRFSSGKL